MNESKDVAKMTDSIIRIGHGTLVQHGKHNDRVYLMKLMNEDLQAISGMLIHLANKYNYSKIVCKIPQRAAPLFLGDGYILEGYIPGFYKGVEDALFVSKFLDNRRLENASVSQLKDIYPYLSTPMDETSVTNTAEDYVFRRLIPADVQDMAKIYTDVFSSYPFPIYNPDYLLKTMKENVQYFGAFKNECLAAVASAEIDMDAKNAEMTDFATLRTHAGHRLAYWLLKLMEEEMKQMGIMTLYTIARLKSIPMNKTFLQMGYKFSGTLINNTHIGGSIETMVLYYRPL